MATPSEHNTRGKFRRGQINPAELHAIEAAQARTQLRKVADDEVIVVTSSRSAPAISLPGFMSLVAGFFIFKGVVIAWLGAGLYTASITVLQKGSIFEQAAAFIMAPDGLSLSLANLFLSVLS